MNRFFVHPFGWWFCVWMRSTFIGGGVHHCPCPAKLSGRQALYWAEKDTKRSRMVVEWGPIESNQQSRNICPLSPLPHLHRQIEWWRVEKGGGGMGTIDLFVKEKSKGEFRRLIIKLRGLMSVPVINFYFFWMIKITNRQFDCQYCCSPWIRPP